MIFYVKTCYNLTNHKSNRYWLQHCSNNIIDLKKKIPKVLYAVCSVVLLSCCFMNASFSNLLILILIILHCFLGYMTLLFSFFYINKMFYTFSLKCFSKSSSTVINFFFFLQIMCFVNNLSFMAYNKSSFLMFILNILYSNIMIKLPIAKWSRTLKFSVNYIRVRWAGWFRYSYLRSCINCRVFTSFSSRLLWL